MISALKLLVNFAGRIAVHGVKYLVSRRTIKDDLAYLFKVQKIVDHFVAVKCVEHYKGKHPKHHLWTIHYKFVVDHVNDSDVVMDVGAGASSSYTQEIASKVKRVDCVDIREDRVSKANAENKFDNVKYKLSDITKDFPENTHYDVVILSHVLEHLHDPIEVLENMKTITNKLIIRLPRYDDHWTYLVKKDLGLDYFKDYDHKEEYTLETAIDLVKKAGWHVDIALNDVDVKMVATYDKSVDEKVA